MSKTPSYVIESFRCTRDQINFLEKSIRQHKEDPYLANEKNRNKTYGALAQLVASSLILPSWEEFQLSRGIPIPAQTWRKFGGATAWQCLKKMGIVKVANYNKEQGRCREFRVTEEFLLNYTRAGLDADSVKPYNLISKRLIRNLPTTKLVDHNRNKYFQGSLVNQQALEVIKHRRCLYNLHKLKEVLQRFEATVTRNPTPKNRRRLISARLAFMTVHRGGTSRPEPKYGPGIYSYMPQYAVSSTGRLVEIGVGLQGCPREMKAAAFEIEDVHNYDLAASQAYGFLRLVSAFRCRDGALKKDYNFEHISAKRLDPTWLHSYLKRSGDANRRTMAAEAGVTYRLWKELFYATLMGGTYSTFDATLSKQGCPQRAYAALQPLREIRSAVMDRITLYVKDELSGRNPQRLRAFGHKLLRVEYNGSKAWIINAAGARAVAFNRQGNLLNGWNDRRVMAHILQGIEAHFIAEITSYSNGFGFKVLSNQHDGLVTYGEIPDECIKAAQKSSSLGRFGKLVKKGFL